MLSGLLKYSRTISFFASLAFVVVLESSLSAQTLWVMTACDDTNESEGQKEAVKNDVDLFENVVALQFNMLDRNKSVCFYNDFENRQYFEVWKKEQRKRSSEESLPFDEFGNVSPDGSILTDVYQVAKTENIVAKPIDLKGIEGGPKKETSAADIAEQNLVRDEEFYQKSYDELSEAEKSRQVKIGVDDFGNDLMVNLCSTSSSMWTGPSTIRSRNAFQNVKAGFEALRGRVKSDDAVLFYWTGHGSFRGNEHYLDQYRGLSIKRSEIINTIRKCCNPRLIVIITDCCAREVKSKLVCESAPCEPAPPGPPGFKGASPLFNRLFFQYSGVVDINGADRGQFGFIHCLGVYRSVFTEAFCGLCEIDMMKSKSWKVFAMELNVDTNKNYCEYASSIELAIQETQLIGIWGLPSENDGNENQKGRIVQVAYHDDRSPAESFDIKHLIDDLPWSKESHWSIGIGDRIVEINGVPVNDLSDFVDIVASVSETIVIKVVESGTNKTYYLKTNLPAREPGKSRLGYRAVNSSNGGVTVIRKEPGTADLRCQLYYPD